MRKNLLAFHAGNALRIFTPQISKKLIRRNLQISKRNIQQKHSINAMNTIQIRRTEPHIGAVKTKIAMNPCFLPFH
ncbi:hypothetical protein FH063_004269 [Azospirillum argentinense]|uniref:Uncharacterized protein n=1 Tax=Azospirillum argentinense TaxID=2970906 RepID=A0A5B0KIT6_9PROT|nr:hypothetical protein FH063_004269 [Azospirillum argentinense]